MLTFFRKIRRSLIESGSARKYLLYAIGEILLVMIGILLALQVNNWNTENENSQTSQLYLKSLITQLDENIRYTDRHLVMCDERIATFDKLFEELNHATIEDDSLNIAMEEVYTIVGTSNLKALAFEELIISNNLVLFEKDLRDKILRYHSHILWTASHINTNLDMARQYQFTYFQSTDMAYEEGFKKSENPLVKDWRSDVASPQFLHATNFFTYRKQILQNFKRHYARINDRAKKLKSELEEHLEK